MDRVVIAVLPYGHALIGRLLDESDPEVLGLSDAQTIRVWGTTRDGGGGGLGLLALEGKQPQTVLDPEGTCRFPRHGYIRMIDVTPGAAKTFGF